MINIPLLASPNQSFSIVLDNNRWDVEVKDTNGTVAVSLTRNNEVVISNLRAVAGMRIIPSEYQEAGNFVMVTNNGEIPNYLLFGASQYLVYLSAAELEVIREPVPPPITAASFSPLAALPLRFKPQGYVLAI